MVATGFKKKCQGRVMHSGCSKDCFAELRSEANDQTTLHPNEFAAGREVLSEIDRIIDARVQAALNGELPRLVPASMGDYNWLMTTEGSPRLASLEGRAISRLPFGSNTESFRLGDRSVRVIVPCWGGRR